MTLINSGQTFPFAYQAYDQAGDLFVMATIYDVSASPLELDNVIMTDLGNGLYSGSYMADIGGQYLVVALVYTDDLYDVVDANRAPWAECYKCSDAPSQVLLLNYGAFDQSVDLPVAAKIYDITSDTIVLRGTFGMAEVLGGVYFVSYTGIVQSSYCVNKAVYTDDSYTEVDPDRPFGSDSVQLISFGSSVITLQPPLTVTGQMTGAILEVS